MPNEKEIALEHAWRYFQFHAQQRISVFNFFVATAGLLVTGLAVTAQASARTWPLGLAASVLLILISLTFWRLDQRVSSMIKLAEEVAVQAEAQLISDPDLRMISREQTLTAGTKFGWFSSWTYGRAFRFIFASMALLGLIGGGFSVNRSLTSEPESSGKRIGNTARKDRSTTATAARPTLKPSSSTTLQADGPVPTHAAN